MLREYREADREFVTHSWLRHQRRVGEFRQMEGEAYTRYMKDKIWSKIEKTIVATPDDDDWFILGYITYGDKTIHMVYVREMFRRRGYGSLLVKAAVPTFGETKTVCTSLPKFPFSDIKGKYKLEYRP